MADPSDSETIASAIDGILKSWPLGWPPIYHLEVRGGVYREGPQIALETHKVAPPLGGADSANAAQTVPENVPGSPPSKKVRRRAPRSMTKEMLTQLEEDRKWLRENGATVEVIAKKTGLGTVTVRRLLSEDAHVFLRGTAIKIRAFVKKTESERET
jgi:hypothetical protein